MNLAQLLDSLRADPSVHAQRLALGSAARAPGALRALPARASTRGWSRPCGARGIAQLYTPPGGGGGARAGGPLPRRPDADRLGQDPVLQPAGLRHHPARAAGAGAVPVPDQGAEPGPDARGARAGDGPRRRHQGPHLRRRHARDGAPGDPQQRPHRGHQPGHAAPGHPAAPHAVGEALREPALRRDRRGAPVPRRLRQPRGQRAAPAAAHRAPSTAPTRTSSAARPPSPTRASWPAR